MQYVLKKSCWLSHHSEMEKRRKKIKESFEGIFSLPKVKYQAMAQIVSSKLFRPTYFKTLRFSADRWKWRLLKTMTNKLTDLICSSLKMVYNLMMFSLLFISFVQCLQLDIALYNSRANFRRRIGIMQRLVLFSIPCPTLCWKLRTPRNHWCGEKYFASLSPTWKRRLLKTYKCGHGSFMYSLFQKSALYLFPV